MLLRQESYMFPFLLKRFIILKYRNVWWSTCKWECAGKWRCPLRTEQQVFPGSGTIDSFRCGWYGAGSLLEKSVTNLLVSAVLSSLYPLSPLYLQPIYLSTYIDIHLWSFCVYVHSSSYLPSYNISIHDNIWVHWLEWRHGRISWVLDKWLFIMGTFVSCLESFNF